MLARSSSENLPSGPRFNLPNLENRATNTNTRNLPGKGPLGRVRIDGLEDFEDSTEISHGQLEIS